MESNGGFEPRAKVKAMTMPGALYGVGTVIGYCAAPQVYILTPDGNAFWWRADLCEALDDETVQILRHVGVELDGEEPRGSEREDT